MTESKLTSAQKVCPLISSAAPVIMESPGVILGSKGMAVATATPAQDVKIVTMAVPCVREQCQWWSPEPQECSIVAGLRMLWQQMKLNGDTLVSVGYAVANTLAPVAKLNNLAPPNDGKSPMARIADALEQLAKKRDDGSRKS